MVAAAGGVDHETLAGLAEKAFSKLPTGGTTSAELIKKVCLSNHSWVIIDTYILKSLTIYVSSRMPLCAGISTTLPLILPKLHHLCAVTANEHMDQIPRIVLKHSVGGVLESGRTSGPKTSETRGTNLAREST